MHEFLTNLVRGKPGQGAGRAGLLCLLDDRKPSVVVRALDRTAIARLAAASAHVLRRAEIRPGDRVVVALGTGPSFVGWVLGAMWVGAVPVPVPPLVRGAGPGTERFARVLSDCTPRAVIGDDAALAAATGSGALAIPAAHAEAIPTDPDLGEPSGNRSNDDGAFVQYTAGSTRSPKGVVVTFANLEANLEAIGRAVLVSPRDRIVSWLPLHHDMGLVGALFFALHFDVPLFLFSPVGFALRPVGWLEAISAHRATLSPAPHFAYSICAYKLREEALAGLDLSSWRLALDGAEPIRAENARAFMARFGRYGFAPDAYHPVYGLAEATLAVAMPRIGEGLRTERISRSALGRNAAEASTDEDDAVDVVAVGRALEGLSIEIRSPEGVVLPDRALGEIVVQGSSVTPRYVGEPSPDRDLLFTGDLGFLHDGVLYVADRLKDIIIQAGTNVYPGELEAAASDVPGVRKGRVVAFGVARPTQGTEDVVVAAETHRRLGRRALAARIRASVQQRTGIVLRDVVLLDPGTLPLTTSGKLMRSRVRERFLANQLQPRGIRRWIARARRRLLKVGIVKG
jgi:acyl-CoA synthetase (AMP-forming)/AMP-acid ligase II